MLIIIQLDPVKKQRAGVPPLIVLKGPQSFAHCVVENIVDDLTR